MKRKLLILLCFALSRACRLTHPFWWLEIKLTGNHCNLALLSYRLNERYDLGVWK